MAKISIVIPALNEELGIVRTIQAIPVQELENIGHRVQVIVIDNGSNDRTSELARSAGAEVILEPIRGYGKAYKKGFSIAKGDIIVTVDADLTYPIEDIPKLVILLEQEKLDFITTNRFAYMKDGVMSQRNRFGNNVLNLTTRLLFNISLKDTQSGMWIFRKSILDSLLLRSNGMPFSEELKLEICYYNRYCWKEVPIEYRVRVGEIKLRGWRDGLENLFYLVRKRIIR